MSVLLLLRQEENRKKAMILAYPKNLLVSKSHLLVLSFCGLFLALALAKLNTPILVKPVIFLNLVSRFNSRGLITMNLPVNLI